jgi:hypothetical protein
MWEQLTPADIERAKRHLALERNAMLSRHAAELKELDTQQDQIDELERLVAAFTAKYLTPEPTAVEPRQPPLNEQPPEEAPEHGQSGGEAAAILRVEQQVSPNFGTPLRKFMRR